MKEKNLLNYVNEPLTPKLGMLKRKASDAAIFSKDQVKKGEFVSFVSEIQNERATTKLAEG